VAAALTVIAALAALLVAVGTPGAVLPVGRAPAIALLAFAVLLIVVVSLGKDVVDNDTESDGRGGGAGSGDEPARVEPMPPAAAPTASGGPTGA
jgi:hypothetical protein